MAGKLNSFSAVLIAAGGLCFVAVGLQLAGLSTDYLQSITTFTVTLHWGLWNYCVETPVATKCFSLVNSGELFSCTAFLHV